MIVLPDGIEGIIFDCDGTLADTMFLHDRAWQMAFDTVGLPCPLEFLDQLMGVPSLRIVEMINQQFSYTLDVQAFTNLKEATAHDLLIEARAIEPVVAVVHEHYGKKAMAVASGGVRKNVIRTLEAIGLEAHFPVILTADDPIRPKPSPDIFEECAKRLGVAAERCIVFEDADSGLRGAREAGMAVFDVRTLQLSPGNH